MRQFANLTSFEGFTGAQQVTLEPLQRSSGRGEASLSPLAKAQRAALDRDHGQIKLAFEVVIHAPLTGTGSFLDGGGTHPDIPAFPKKLLGALDKAIASRHTLYLVVGTICPAGPIGHSVSPRASLFTDLEIFCMTQVSTLRVLGNAAWRRPLVSLTMIATFLVAGSLQAQSLPQPVPLPPATVPPVDKPYPGTIALHVDATDVQRRIYTMHETIPVPHAGALTLLFPQWNPGDHAPNVPLEKLAGLVMTAQGKRLRWVRDTVDTHAFHVDIPAGVSALELQYQYLGSTETATGQVLITPTMLDLQWQTVVLYPAGYFARDLQYTASVTLPTGWTTLTSIDGGKVSGDTTTFPTMALDALIDQPVMAGLNLKQVILAEQPAPVRLDVAVQDPADLAGLPALAQSLKPLIAQTSQEFGSHHYDHYDLMIFMSDELKTYYEHHRSGENVAPAHFLRSATDVPNVPYVAHGYMHSWNGLYRKPAEMWTPNLNTPERDSMLWVFEGLTSYLEDVLCARAGMFDHNASSKHTRVWRQR